MSKLNFIFLLLLSVSPTKATEETFPYKMYINTRLIEKTAHKGINEGIRWAVANHSELIEADKAVTQTLTEKQREVSFTKMTLNDQLYQKLQVSSPPLSSLSILTEEGNNHFSLLEIMPAFEAHIEKYKKTLEEVGKKYFKETIKTVCRKIAEKKNSNIEGYKKQLSKAMNTYEILQNIIEKMENNKDFCHAVTSFKRNLLFCREMEELCALIDKEGSLVCSMSTWLPQPSSVPAKILYDQQVLPRIQQDLFRKIKALTYNNALRACQIIIKYLYTFGRDLDKEGVEVKPPFFEAFGTQFKQGFSTSSSSAPSTQMPRHFMVHPKEDGNSDE